MRRSLVLLGLAAICLRLAFPASAQTIVQRAIDPSASKAQFSIAHIFVTRVAGTVPVLSGAVDLPAGSLIPTHVSATLDASRIHTGEDDRDSSLESFDYFDAKAFPTWTFESTRIVPTGQTAFECAGILTMHGVAQPEQLSVTVSGDAEHPRYHAVAMIDRRAFGMKGTRLDPVIGTTADVTLDVILK